MVWSVIVVLEEGVYLRLKEMAEEKKVSIASIIRQILTSYFRIEDTTKNYSKTKIANRRDLYGEKAYYRILVKMERRNEVYIRNELRKQDKTVNELLKEILLVTA